MLIEYDMISEHSKGFIRTIQSNNLQVEKFTIMSPVTLGNYSFVC